MLGRGHAGWWLVVFALLLVATVGCEFPRDPRGTLEQVRGGTLTQNIEDATREARDLDWRLQNLVIMPIRKLPDQGG